MKSKTAFTKKDLIVVLVCLIFLLSNIAAISEGGRKRAKAAVCLSNLHKWGQIFNAYTADNDGFFHRRGIAGICGYRQMWPYVYKPYYNDKMMRFCPTADNPQLVTGPFGTWNYGLGQYYPTKYPCLLMAGEREYDVNVGSVVEGFFTGSYGMNRCVEDIQGGSDGTSAGYFRKVDVKNADKVPVLADSQYLYYGPCGPDNPAPAYSGDYTGAMKIICIDRHAGFINVCFMDWSARKVGLKELWTLKHTPLYDTCGSHTICGNGGDAQTCAAAWDEAAPWMKDFPEY